MTNEERSALIAQGWTPPAPVPVDPKVGSVWTHSNGGVYEVIAIANLLDTERHFKSVIYRNVKTKTVWTWRADDWHHNYMPKIEAEQTPPVPVDPDLAEANRLYEAMDWPDGLKGDTRECYVAFIREGIKRGRELERAEATPEMVWIKHDGSVACPVLPSFEILFKDINGFHGKGVAWALQWRIVTHYAIITQPEEK
jgi:hypothetical protein